MDVQEPIVGSDPLRRLVTRACYPTLGIEVELGEEPVLQCSRWEPDNEQGRLGELRKQYLKTPDGKAFADQVAVFEESSAADLADPEHADAPAVHDSSDMDLAAVCIADSYKVTP